VNHAVPGVASVVDDDVDFTVAELCGLLDERLKILVVEHVARGGNGFPATLVDSIGNILCLFYFAIIVSREFPKDFPHQVHLINARDSHRCHVQERTLQDTTHQHQYHSQPPSPPHSQTTSPPQRQCPAQSQ
jgi:hypothetical protein